MIDIAAGLRSLEKLSESPELSEEARAFLRPAKRSRCEDVVSSSGITEVALTHQSQMDDQKLEIVNLTVELKRTIEDQHERQNSKKIKCLKEATLDWCSDLGALRKEIPAAKATLRALFEIEVAAGALPKNPQLMCGAPQIQFRHLAAAALRSSRSSVRQRLDVISAPPSTRKRRKNDDDVFISVSEMHVSSGDESVSESSSIENGDADILSVSEVMKAADVWSLVWKSYMVDLSNRMHQIKCEFTGSSFSNRRNQKVGPGIVVAVHKYKKPDDWVVARRALEETRDLYEKRIRELLEEIFVRADIFDAAPMHTTYDRICKETARGIASKLRVNVIP
jgi:hypothetical protein